MSQQSLVKRSALAKMADSNRGIEISFESCDLHGNKTKVGFLFFDRRAKKANKEKAKLAISSSPSDIHR